MNNGEARIAVAICKDPIMDQDNVVYGCGRATFRRLGSSQHNAALKVSPIQLSQQHVASMFAAVA